MNDVLILIITIQNTNGDIPCCRCCIYIYDGIKSLDKVSLKGASHYWVLAQLLWKPTHFVWSPFIYDAQPLEFGN